MGYRASPKFPLDLMGFQAASSLPLISDQTSLAPMIPCAGHPTQQLEKGFQAKYKLVARTFLKRGPLSVELMSYGESFHAGVYSS